MMNRSSHKLTRLASAAGLLVMFAAFLTAAALAGGRSTVLSDSRESALPSEQLDLAIAAPAVAPAPFDTRDAAIAARAVGPAPFDLRSPDTQDAFLLPKTDATLDPAVAAAIAARRSAPTPVAVQADPSKGFDWATFGVIVAAALVGIALLAVVGLGARSRHRDAEETGTVSAA
jgi:hypothetical protein